jgi:hypothetical protein
MIVALTLCSKNAALQVHVEQNMVTWTNVKSCVEVRERSRLRGKIRTMMSVGDALRGMSIVHNMQSRYIGKMISNDEVLIQGDEGARKKIEGEGGERI